ncbi:anhydro-N-acetylmuramic acid kinase [Rhodobacterales bacterium HKCCE2091]|nr:anhydro-N-acetylmuramic acid kinase [Rhodobacterales bacterium HKCCE2091]
MSGTSMDGVDIAVIETDGVGVTGFGPTAYRPYTAEEKAAIRAALGRWPGDDGVAEAAAAVERAHAEAMDGIGDVVALGFHGQTLAHDPANGRTHQAGDGAALSERLGLPVVWDFRSADVGLGGQGAPLAPFWHWALARRMGAEGPVAFLNLGGVGNITWVDPNAASPDAPAALLAFDTGPANAPLDDLCRARGLGDHDPGGRRTAEGRIDRDGIAEFLRDPYFLKMPPKSLDRGAFDYLVEAVSGLKAADALATLGACAAASVARGMEHLPEAPTRMLVTGGGRHNAGMMASLRRLLPMPVEPVEAAGFDGDALEAQAFAYLAIRVALGMTTSAPGTTGVPAPVGGGTVSGALAL